MKFLRFAVVLGVLAVACLPVMAEGGGGLGMKLIRPAPGTTFWTLVTFLFMAFILGKFAWRPLIDALEGREKSIRDSLDQAKQDREEAEKLLAQHRELVNESRRDRAEALAQGRKDAEQLKAEMLEEARKQREQLLEQSHAQIEAAVREARAELRGTAVDLSIQAAEKLIARNLDEPTQRRLIEDYLADLERGRGPSGELPS